MRRFIVVAIVVVVVLGITGCDKLMPTVSEAKVQAAERWNATRAEMVYAVALEQFKSGQLDTAAREANKALSMNEKCLPARILLAKVEIVKGRYAAARKQLTTVLEQAPQSAEAFYLLGIAQEKSGSLPEALASYRRAYELDESNLAPISAAAEVLVRMGRVREAQLYVDSYAPKAEDEVSLLELGGRLSMMTKEYAKAAAYYQRALDGDVRNPYYRESFGRALFLAGRYAEAVDALEPLMQGECKGSPWAYATLGDCYLALSKPALACEAYTEAERRLEPSAGMRANLAKAILAKGDVPRAIYTAKRALAMDRQCLEATLVLAYALLQDGQATEAIRYLAEAAGIHKDDSMVWCLLGKAYAANGDNEKAVKCYGAALQADPDSKVARELLNETQARLSRR